MRFKFHKAGVYGDPWASGSHKVEVAEDGGIVDLTPRAAEVFEKAKRGKIVPPEPDPEPDEGSGDEAAGAKGAGKGKGGKGGRPSFLG